MPLKIDGYAVLNEVNTAFRGSLNVYPARYGEQATKEAATVATCKVYTRTEEEIEAKILVVATTANVASKRQLSFQIFDIPLAKKSTIFKTNKWHRPRNSVLAFVRYSCSYGNGEFGSRYKVQGNDNQALLKCYH
ncbi:hypothetical protein Tco_0506006 [Tanacetum coccineum]